MKGSDTKMMVYFDGPEKRLVIPVYQRKYDWQGEQCLQLWGDLKRVIRERKESHFFGNVVSSVVGNGAVTEYHIIDGQQRITTVTLLLLAMRNLLRAKRIKLHQPDTEEKINKRLFVNADANDDRIRLCPVEGDREALAKLYGEEADFDEMSNLTSNYRLFCNLLVKEEAPVDALCTAIERLEIISITLEPHDNAQLIFESLNSTGLALTEGDKIRNYVLMGQPPRQQNELYRDYWKRIEQCSRNDVSNFVRDYLSVKQQVTPNTHSVYRAFKEYVQKMQLPVAEILEDLRRYARVYEKLLCCRGGTNDRRLDDCLYRMSRLEIVVTRPFLMEVFRLYQDGKLTGDDVLQIFLITESYLFRRNICNVPASALSKIFLNLNREVLRFDNTADHYVDKLIYALTSKKESWRFPTDEEFLASLAKKQVYLMKGKYKAYLFERMENFGTVETKDVYTQLDNSVYTIEHIMPQHLTPSWTEALGPDAAEIHRTWLHRLANLTLSGYNPSLSNKTFAEKRDHKTGGFRASGLKMNQRLSGKERWGLTELEERNAELLALAKKIWAYPESDFVPAVGEYESYSLDDENADLTGRNIAKYSYRDTEQPVTSWVDMFEQVIRFLHGKDRSVLIHQANTPASQLSHYITFDEKNLLRAIRIDEDIYVEGNTNTEQKMMILRRLFALYQADPMDLVFYLKDEEKERRAEANRYENRKRYWAYALPLIQQKHSVRGTFADCKPIASNTSSSGVGRRGFKISCVATRDFARIDFYMGNADAAKNEKAFRALLSHKKEIEHQLDVELIWELADKCKASWISLLLPQVSVANEADWPRMAEFHAEWSDKMCSVILPLLPEEEDISARLDELAAIFQEWANRKHEANAHEAKSTRRYTRFTTDAMSRILPDIPDAPSSWGTANHYFYEVVNDTGKDAFIKLVINARNATEDFLAICEQINEYYPAVFPRKKNWQWRQIFKSSTIDIAGDISKEKIFRRLDDCFEEIRAFEVDLQKKLAMSQENENAV